MMTTMCNKLYQWGGEEIMEICVEQSSEKLVDCKEKGKKRPETRKMMIGMSGIEKEKRENKGK